MSLTPWPCGVITPTGFDREELLGQPGDELALEMETPRSDLERREFIINSVQGFYEKGNLLPPYVFEAVEETTMKVVDILQEAGVDTSLPEPEIDWSKCNAHVATPLYEGTPSLFLLIERNRSNEH